MNKSTEPRQIFYNDKKAHSIITPNKTLSLARVTNTPVAIINAGNQTSNTILAVSGNNSTHTAITPSSQHKKRYTPYGFSPLAASAPIAFAGELHDSNTQGYLLGNGYRLYLPSLMRFASPDSITPFDILNSYAYCAGDPVNFTDSSGHMRRSTQPSPTGNKVVSKNTSPRQVDNSQNNQQGILETQQKLASTQKAIDNYQTPRQKIEASIRETKDNIATARSYDDFREERRYGKELSSLESQLKRLPLQDSSGELAALHKQKADLSSKLTSQMSAPGRPGNAEGIARPLPEEVRQGTSGPAYSGFGSGNWRLGPPKWH